MLQSFTYKSSIITVTVQKKIKKPNGESQFGILTLLIGTETKLRFGTSNVNPTPLYGSEA